MVNLSNNIINNNVFNKVEYENKANKGNIQ